MYKITFCHKGEKTEHSLYLPLDDVYCLTDATLSLEEGKAGELSLGIPDDNTAKKEIVCLTDEIIVYRDSTELFRGRCITKQTDFYLTGTLKVEGILTYLYDTYFPPFEFQGAPTDLLKKVISNHNSFVDAEKQFQIGIVTVEDPNDYIARSSEGYNRTLNILSDKFVGDTLGGYFRARVSGGKRYLDYLKTYGTRASQTVELGKNILDLAVEVEYSSLITAVLPLGAKSNATDENEKTSYVTVESVNNGDLYIRDKELIKKYGFICECVEWQDVTEPANLKSKATAYLAQKSMAIETLTIRAVDLYLAGESDRPFQLGDMVTVKSTPHGIEQDIELSAMEMDLLNPANDTFTFGAVFGSFTDKSTSDNRNLVDSVSNLTVVVGRISSDYITAKTLVAEVAKLGYVTAKEIEAEYIKTTDADLKYANIDFSNIDKASIGEFFAKSGLIENMVVGDQTITGELVGVTIKGNLIEGETVAADKLVIKGEDGLYYKLNVDALGKTTAQADPKYQSGLDGSVLIKKSIIAEKISIKDLVAFDATIAGFNITDSALYSGVKDSVSNGTRGIYLGKDGQVAFGDTNGYLKYYKDSDGKWKLAILADSVIFSSGKNAETAINESVASSTEEFYQSTSSTSLKGGKWSTTPPAWKDGTYIWRRTAVVYGDGSSEYTPSSTGVCITGNTGETGKQGEKGKTGETGLPALQPKRNWQSTYTIVGTTTSCELSAFNRTPVVGDVFINLDDSSNTGTWEVTEVTSTKVTFKLLSYVSSKGKKGDTGATGAAGKDGKMLYSTSSTAAATAAKVVTITPTTSFSLYTGATVSVYFTYANTAATPTLNVNGTGAKPIYVYGAVITDKYYWSAKSTVQFTYDGSHWVMNDNSAMSIVASWCAANDKTLINGGKLAAGSVATKSLAAKAVTAEKISVDDLAALNADVGGVHIGDNAIYSGAKTSIDNTATGFYLGKDGQAAFGNASDYLKLFKSGSTWKMAFSGNLEAASGSFNGDVTAKSFKTADGVVERSYEYGYTLNKFDRLVTINGWSTAITALGINGFILEKKDCFPADNIGIPCIVGFNGSTFKTGCLWIQTNGSITLYYYDTYGSGPTRIDNSTYDKYLNLGITLFFSGCWFTNCTE